MERYTTEHAKVECSIPARMRKMTAMEIVNAVSKIEHKTGYSKKSAGFKMIEAASKAVFNPADWKAPIYAKFTVDANGCDATEWVKAAIVWYHGAQPLESFVGVYSQGYAC
jgi:hypothetical protein